MQFSTIVLAVAALAAPLASAKTCYRLEARIITEAWGREDLLTARVILRQQGVHKPICDNWSKPTQYKKSDRFAKIGCFDGQALTGILTIFTDGYNTEYDPANRQRVRWKNTNVKTQDVEGTPKAVVVDNEFCV